MSEADKKEKHSDRRDIDDDCTQTFHGDLLRVGGMVLVHRGCVRAGAVGIAQTEGAGSRAGVLAPSDFPWDTVQWVERRYKIEAMHFKARDETGIGWWGDDDVMIQTVDAKGWTVSDEIGSVDYGETHSFVPEKSCIIAVRPGIVVLGETSVCDDVGEPAPLWFEVEFWEKDFEILPDIPLGFCNTVGPGTPEPGRHGGPHFAHDSCDDNDDFIGRARLDSRYGNSRPRCPMSAMNLSKPSD